MKVGVLTGGVAHDFNNLLVAIMGNSELALRSLDEDARARDYVRRSVEAAERGLERDPQRKDLRAILSEAREKLGVDENHNVNVNNNYVKNDSTAENVVDTEHLLQSIRAMEATLSK